MKLLQTATTPLQVLQALRCARETPGGQGGLGVGATLIGRAPDLVGTMSQSRLSLFCFLASRCQSVPVPCQSVPCGTRSYCQVPGKGLKVTWGPGRSSRTPYTVYTYNPIYTPTQIPGLGGLSYPTAVLAVSVSHSRHHICNLPLIMIYI